MSDAVLAAMQRQIDSSFERGLQSLSADAFDSLRPQVLGAYGRPVHTMAIDPTSVHVNQPLANVLVFFKNRQQIADSVLPVINVEKQSDVYFVYAADTAFDTAKIDTAGQLGQVAEVSLSISTSPYKVTNRTLRDWVPLQVIENQDSPLNLLAHTEQNLARYLTLAREIRVANVVFAAGNYGANTLALAGGQRWNISSGDPVNDHLSAITAINVNDELLGVYGELVWLKMINNPNVKSYFTSRPETQMGKTPMLMNSETWGNALGLRGVHIGKMKNNTVNDPGSATYGYVWGKSAAIIHVPESPGIMVTAFGYTFRWRPFQHRVVFDPLRGPEGAYMIQVNHADAEQVIDSTGATGYLYQTVID